MNEPVNNFLVLSNLGYFKHFHTLCVFSWRASRKSDWSEMNRNLFHSTKYRHMFAQLSQFGKTNSHLISCFEINCFLLQRERTKHKQFSNSQTVFVWILCESLNGFVVNFQNYEYQENTHHNEIIIRNVVGFRTRWLRFIN